MSVQFGRWNFDGRPVDREYLAKAEGMLAPYGPDGEGTYIKDSVGILFRAFHTTKESRSEAQPFVTPSGAVLCWDGRLDNRQELIQELQAVLTIGATDLAVIAAAYEAWGTNCFAKLIGDWALSVWDLKDRSLTLAKDPIGTRRLYYSVDSQEVSWSTILDPLVLLAGKTFALEEEYIAGWLSFFPATHLTPYVGIHSVPPSCFVRLTSGGRSIHKYWDFDPGKRIRYRTDGEYEEHFRQVFGEAVRRRLRSDNPVLAELSGGMDSSSIVCMADTIIAQGAAETPRLDTLSYYNDSEPNWNERPYLMKVEEKRGREGCRIDLNVHNSLISQFHTGYFVASPGSGINRSSESGIQFAHCMASQGNRVLLSGIGGDEVTGGIPTPTPELEDLLAGARLRRLAHQLKAWALCKRKPWIHLLLAAARGFLAPGFLAIQKHRQPAAWLNSDFVKRNQVALIGYPRRIKLFDALPSFQECVSTLEAVQRQLQCDSGPSEPVHEKRYPFLDRDLLAFVFAIPREQLVRPGERRSLMRRALAGMVPREILQRKRKAFVARAPLTSVAADSSKLIGITKHLLSSSLGYVDSSELSKVLENTSQGHEVPIAVLMRTITVEAWLTNLVRRNLLRDMEANAGMPPCKPSNQSCDSHKGNGLLS